ncbi:enterobactin ABC transporter permease [Agaricicola taiwanensis]|uniref:Enterobactin ABC transporter permease n=1 Tax=Agaricicola taiwanensis TaxID=591372 RepID=A0A8J2YJT9_9RHOB|nr:iron chelate uptake ABC transporter family permease subunit [Agaricicola taiwanensis]GGE48705.1 enterobactin ABC transporter permease [Agaricicola taiwanensis]
MPDIKRPTPVRLLIGLTALAVLCVVLFMTLNARGRWDFVLPFRGAKVAAMIAVAYAIAVSTVLFQTVTCNRILTPSIMGFDSLFLLLQTCLVFFTGATISSDLSPQLQFGVNVGLMVVFSGLLFSWLFTGANRSIHLLVLAGIVFGMMFRSLSSFMGRLLDPDAFTIVTDAMFASFNSIDTTLLAASLVIIGGSAVVVWRLTHLCDVLALGRETAISLGVNHRRAVMMILSLVAILVSVSTALVGPVTFFGLMVANLAYLLVGRHEHRFLVPVAVLLAVISLVGGQLILERVFAFDSALSIIIEFIGGLVFIILLVRGSTR